MRDSCSTWLESKPLPPAQPAKQNSNLPHPRGSILYFVRIGGESSTQAPALRKALLIDLIINHSPAAAARSEHEQECLPRAVDRQQRCVSLSWDKTNPLSSALTRERFTLARPPAKWTLFCGAFSNAALPLRCPLPRI
jgi:hypothetical protein